VLQVSWTTVVVVVTLGVMNLQTTLFLVSVVFSLTLAGTVIYNLSERVDTCREHMLNHLTLHNEYDELFFDYKALRLEVARLNSRDIQLGEAQSETVPFLPYYMPVDIQEPLPYIYESE